jgi:transposase
MSDDKAAPPVAGEYDGLIERATWLENGQDDPQSRTIRELVDALAAMQARIAALTEALVKIAAPSTVAGAHEQDRDKKLQSIARAALKGGENV